uniref:Uncharacterized protein n=1 Tax=Romanomermis culicivorax TaxID=13658 RepID=A0A915HRT4_ROMCU
MKLPREFNARILSLQNSYQAMYQSCQARAAGLAYPLAKAVLEDKKDSEPTYTNIQVWKKKVDNMDPRIRFWEVIDKKKVKDIVDVGKGLKVSRIGYKDHLPYNRTGTTKVSKQWIRKMGDGYQRKESESLSKDRKGKDESHHFEEREVERSGSKERKCKRDRDESERRKQEE